MMWNSRALVFDLDDTLLSEGVYFQAVFSRFCSNHNWPDEAFISLISDFRRLRKKQKDIFEYFLDKNVRFIEDQGDGVASRSLLHEELFELYTKIEVSLDPLDGVSNWMDFARTHDMKLGVITNGVVNAQRNKWRSLRGVNNHKIEFLPARTLENEKPHPDAFWAMSRALQVPMDETTYFGDRFDNDLSYPLSQGATGVYVDQDAKCVAVKGNLCVSPDLGGAFFALCPTGD
jgi:putative hydrolase of the HAD superfamily